MWLLLCYWKFKVDFWSFFQLLWFWLVRSTFSYLNSIESTFSFIPFVRLYSLYSRKQLKLVYCPSMRTCLEFEIQGWKKEIGHALCREPKRKPFLIPTFTYSSSGLLSNAKSCQPLSIHNWNSLFTHLARPKISSPYFPWDLFHFRWDIFFVLNDRKYRVVYPIDLIMSNPKKFLRPPSSHISLENCIQEEDERKRNFEIPPQLLSSFPVSF